MLPTYGLFCAAGARTTASPATHEIAAKNPHAIRGDKRLFDLAASGAGQHEVLKAESVEQTALIGSPNQIEAVMSQMQKRAAVFAEA